MNFATLAGSILLLASSVGYSGSPLAGPPGMPPHDGHQRTDRFIVVPKSGVDPAEFARWTESVGLSTRNHHPWEGDARVVHPLAGADLEAAIRICERSDLVEFVEPDYWIRPLRTPDDPRFVDGSLWALENSGADGGVAGADVDASPAWEVITDASSVVVAIVDSGIRTTHEDLAANLWTNPEEVAGNGLDDDGDGIVDDVHGFDATTNRGDPTDTLGHGTHVAGIIGAVGNNGRGVTGMAWKVRIMALRFIASDQGGSTSDAITCIDYAVAHGARVINASWGSSARSRSLERALNRARSAGVILVGAAGNEGANVDRTPIYPGAYAADNIVCVTATTRGDGLYPEGSYGSSSVDLAAPGVSILSTWLSADDSYALATGTSMATPMVTGALALLIARHPAADYRTCIQAVLQSVDPLPALTGKTVTGGRLNVARALLYLDQELNVAPQLTLLRADSGLGRLQVIGSPNAAYVVESSSDLVTWGTQAGGTANSGGGLELTIPVDDGNQRFFRARLGP